MSYSEETFSKLFEGDGGVRRLTPEGEPTVFQFPDLPPEELRVCLYVDKDGTAMLIVANPTDRTLPVHLLLDYPQAGIDPFGRWAGYLLNALPGEEAPTVQSTDITSRFVTELQGGEMKAYLFTPEPAKWIPRLSPFRRVWP